MANPWKVFVKFAKSGSSVSAILIAVNQDTNENVQKTLAGAGLDAAFIQARADELVTQLLTRDAALATLIPDNFPNNVVALIRDGAAPLPAAEPVEPVKPKV